MPCYYGQKQASFFPPFPGDPSNFFIEVLGYESSLSTRYRINEYANITTSSSGPMSEPPTSTVKSVSYNFQIPSTLGNISSSDLNPEALLQCYHEQYTDSADMADLVGTTGSNAANQASVELCCAASDPLFANPVEPIQFDITVTINSKTNEATITGSHTCFPSHQIKIGNQVVYNKNPTFVSFFTLTTCLLGYPRIQTKVSCTVPLDGVHQCH